MNANAIKISLNFPARPIAPIDQRQFVDLLLGDMRKNGDIKRAGYVDEKLFEKDLFDHVGGQDIAHYGPPPSEERETIERIIREAIEKSHALLPHPDLPIFIFVYPWFPTPDDQKQFEGSSAFAAYYTMHIFINLKAYTRKAVEHSIVHEWNHLVFYRYHDGPEYELGEHIVMEGLAEVFREEVLNDGHDPWTQVLDEKESRESLASLEPRLHEKSRESYKELFLGSKKYKRWTGYSIGYHAVKKFREKNKNYSWEQVLKEKPEDILRAL